MTTSCFWSECCYFLVFYLSITWFSLKPLFIILAEKAMAPHSSSLAWKIPWTEEPGRLQSLGSRRVGHDWDFTFTFHFHALEKELATHSSVLAWRIPGTGEPGGLPQSQTRLKWLSSSSSSSRDNWNGWNWTVHCLCSQKCSASN